MVSWSGFRSWFPLVAIALLSLTAGCLAAPSAGQTGPVSLTLINDGNTTHEFSVWVADGELGRNAIAIHLVNEPTDYATPGQGLTTYTFTEEYGTVSAIEVPGNRTRSLGTQRVAPGERYETNVTDYETGDTIVVADRRDGRIVSLITANCDDMSLGFVSVTADPVRTTAGYSCS